MNSKKCKQFKQVFWLFVLTPIGSPVGCLADQPKVASVCKEAPKRIVDSIRDANLVFQGEIKSIGPPPTFWSGSVVKARQSVTYRVEEILLGELKSGSEFVIRHVVLDGTKNTEPGENRLSKKRFRVGSSLFLIVVQHGEYIKELDWSYGTLVGTRENKKLIKSIIAHCRDDLETSP